MSILDGLPSSPAEWENAMGIMVPRMAEFLEKADLTPRQRSVIEHMRDGMSLGEILGFKPEHRDALFVQSYRLLEAGEPAKARDVLTVLYQLEPLDARTIFALAGTYQLQGDYATAGKLYVHFLALDATNGAGHLRLGECFLANQEYESAGDCFTNARDFANRSKDADTAARAEQLLAVVAEKAAGA
ncbi:hypothetical protein [Prosthecomicrobium sp. N25]|uniref:hypothetical protein n=1 Tax=Prosthecomicrobium sp. N25 TaxID=3129254 RepID=UPI00307842AC